MPKKIHNRAKQLQKKGLPEDVAWGRAWNEAKGRTGKKKKRRKS